MKNLHGIIAAIVVNIIFWGGLALIGYLIIMSFAALFSFALGGFLLFSVAATIAAYVWSGFTGLLGQEIKNVNQNLTESGRDIATQNIETRHHSGERRSKRANKAKWLKETFPDLEIKE